MIRIYRVLSSVCVKMQNSSHQLAIKSDNRPSVNHIRAVFECLG